MVFAHRGRFSKRFEATQSMHCMATGRGERDSALMLPIPWSDSRFGFSIYAAQPVERDVDIARSPSVPIAVCDSSQVLH